MLNELYLSTVIDLFNSDVVAFLMSKQLNVDFAINTLNALSDSGQVPQTACIFHSDQVFTYTHERFVEALKTKGFTQSFSRVGNCWDNTCAESFFWTSEGRARNNTSEKSLELY